jgi:hypothetical protein
MNDAVANQVPDDQLTPEELAERKKWEAFHAKEKSYDNSWEKNQANGYHCDFKHRVASSSTDFSNLKIDFFDWDFHMKIGQPWQVIRIPGFYHSYDCEYYCYPLELGTDPNEFKERLIPFNKNWNILKWDMKIEEYTSYRYKWDEVRHNDGFTGELYRNGELFYRTGGATKADVFAYLTVAQNNAQSHPANFATRDWKTKILGHKVWYHSNPCVITAVNDLDGIMFRISSDSPDKRIPVPKHWDEDDENGICTARAWRESYESGTMVEWNSPEIKYYRKDS